MNSRYFKRDSASIFLLPCVCSKYCASFWRGMTCLFPLYPSLLFFFLSFCNLQLTSISEVEEEQRYREEELERIIASYEADRSAVQNVLDRVDRNESELSDEYSSSERSLPMSPASHPLLRTRSDSNLSRTSTRQCVLSLSFV